MADRLRGLAGGLDKLLVAMLDLAVRDCRRGGKWAEDGASFLRCQIVLDYLDQVLVDAPAAVEQVIREGRGERDHE